MIRFLTNNPWPGSEVINSRTPDKSPMTLFILSTADNTRIEVFPSVSYAFANLTTENFEDHNCMYIY
jgi:hypothetical protein